MLSSRGCVDFATRVGLTEIHKWDLEETRVGGPFPQILDVDVFVNCIYLTGPIPSFITRDLINRNNRKLSVVVDVSCDTSNPHNPGEFSSWSETVERLKSNFQCQSIRRTLLLLNQPFESFQVRTPVHFRANHCLDPQALDVISIDHFPSLVPLESSTEFSALITPHLADCYNSLVWTRAENLFKEKSAKAIESFN